MIRVPSLLRGTPPPERGPAALSIPERPVALATAPSGQTSRVRRSIWHRVHALHVVLAVIHVLAMALAGVAGDAALRDLDARDDVLDRAITRAEVGQERKLRSIAWMASRRAELIAQVGNARVDGFEITSAAVENAAITHGSFVSIFESDSAAGAWVIRVHNPGYRPYRYSLNSIHLRVAVRLLDIGEAHGFTFDDLKEIKFEELPVGSGKLRWQAIWDNGATNWFADPSGRRVSRTLAGLT